MSSSSSAASGWHEIRIGCSDTDEASALCHAYGASLIETISDSEIRVFIEGDCAAFVAQLPTTMKVLSESEVENRNWHESCPELWTPKRISGISVVPVTGTHNLPNRASDEIFIIPGTGFGTGHHPATAMLIERLQHISPSPKSVLDLGCGSGILALVARHLWKDIPVDAIDNDPLALENAADNCAINATQDIPLLCGTLSDAPLRHYDLIVANLYCSLLVQLQSAMRPRCSRIILSGVMESEEQTLRHAFSEWRFISSQIVDGWYSAEFASD